MGKNKAHPGIRAKLNLFAAAVVVLFTGVVYGLVIPLVEREKRTEREGTLSAVVETATSLMDYYEKGIRTYAWKHDPSFPRTRNEARQRVLAHLRPMRFNRDEHIFILDGSARMVLHPLKPELEGAHMDGVKDPGGRPTFLDLAVQAQQKGEVFIRHTWQARWSSTEYEPQTTCARYFYPWNWVVCSSMYTQDIDDAVRDIKFTAGMYLAAGSLAAWLVLLAVASLITRPVTALSRQVKLVTERPGRSAADIITVRTHDEIGDLADAFRLTVDRLQYAMRQLGDNEENLRITLDSIGDAVIATNTGGSVIRMNPVAEKLTGWSRGDAAGRPLPEVFVIVDALTRRPCENPVEKVIRTGGTVGLANHTLLISRDGREYQIADSGAPIRRAGGKVDGVVLVFRDVTGEYRVQQELRENERLLADMFDSIRDGISVLDTDLTIRRVNGVMNAWYADNRPLEGKKCFTCYHNGDAPCDPCPTLRCIASGVPESDTVPGLPGSGVEWLELFSYPMKDAETGAVTGVVEFVRDISGRKKAEQGLEASLREKDVLLKEIHHRVKNNLQVVMSLLSMQSRSSDDPAVAGMFRESMNRVRSMALIHEELYRTHDLGSIPLQHYLEKMAQHISNAYGVSAGTAAVRIDAGGITMGIDRAVPLGLMLNELISNALKHAFPPGRSGPGTVSVTGRAEADGTTVFTVADDGVGIPEGLPAEDSPSLGLKLVQLLAEQLQGTLRVERDRGTAFTVRIPRA